VPANPIDFAINGSNIFTLSGTPDTGDVVFPYGFSGASGQLTVNQNSVQPIGARQGRAIVATSIAIYVLDDEPLTVQSGNGAGFPPATYLSQILPFTAGSGGALEAQTGGAVPDDTSQFNPVFLIAESKGKWVYLANHGSTTGGTVQQSGVVGYQTDPSTHQLIPMAQSPFGMGSGPQCLLEDPSNQYVYTANFNDSTVTGRRVDANSGVLVGLKEKTAAQTFKLEGPANWCFVSGRTS